MILIYARGKILMPIVVTSAAQPGPDDHVLTLCHMLANRIGKAFATELESQDMTVAEWRVLLTLAQHQNASGQEITGRWAMDKMAVNRAIKNLERGGHIKKKRSKADRRTINLQLTARGRKIYDDLLPMANDRYHALLSGLDKKEEQQLRQALLKMIAHTDSLID
jgi:DNA-binding MarR family transcriptional regulator|tara:strand:+ start:72 stop:566 length:495 start_codon:yes stop_codon:yes gene_type:complete